jgi:hypothetical protein
MELHGKVLEEPAARRNLGHKLDPLPFDNSLSRGVSLLSDEAINSNQSSQGWWIRKILQFPRLAFNKGMTFFMLNRSPRHAYSRNPSIAVHVG